MTKDAEMQKHFSAHRTYTGSVAIIVDYIFSILIILVSQYLCHVDKSLN